MISSSIEILAPAGNPKILKAAVDAHADAVYLGLKQFNARRGALNFSPEELREGVAYCHQNHVKVYLTLNIDLNQREINQALRILCLAQDCHVDAVLIRDPALIMLIPQFPLLSFHFSTQAAISSSAGAQAAQQLKISRVVLPRELSEQEILAITEKNIVETEVFVQGALCFSISGRCLLSSWLGGRSGNRGTCASPCRFNWHINHSKNACNPFSMHDLSLAKWVKKLIQLKVTSLKIEGRLKKTEWVHKATSLFHQLKINPDENLSANGLADYTGRQMTDQYFTAERRFLVGESARPVSTDFSDLLSENGTILEEKNEEPIIKISIDRDEKLAILFTWSSNQVSETFRIPARPIKKIEKCISLQQMESQLQCLTKFHCQVEYICSEIATCLLMPSSVNLIEKQFNQFLRKLVKSPDSTIRFPLPKNLQSFFTPHASSCPENHYVLGNPITRVRLLPQNILKFNQQFPKIPILAEFESVEQLNKIFNDFTPSTQLIVALPQLFFEAQHTSILAILQFCENHHLGVEVNSWDGWVLAKKYSSLSLEAGTGLMVLNSFAAQMLNQLGMKRAMISIEADQQQIEELTHAAQTPLSLTVFGRPPLFISRVPPPACTQETPCTFTDQREYELTLYTTPELTFYYPTKPFNWTHYHNSKIRISQLVADLTFSPNPLHEYQQLGKENSDLRFNYERTLK